VSVISRPTELPKTERQWFRRGQLLDAARQVFEVKGYHVATVSDIVQAAGLSQGAFYLYFADKKAIFAALQDELATLMRRRIYWATRNEEDPRKRVVAGLKAFFEFCEEYRDWNHRLLTEGLGIDPSFEASHRHLQDVLAEAFHPTFKSLGIKDSVLAAFALIGMAVQLAYWRHFHETSRPIKTAALAEACAGLFLDGAASRKVLKS
jgi:AcrR family transcriptional regulator